MPRLCSLLLVLATLQLQASSSVEWRFWDSGNGLAERFVVTIGRDPAGAVWLTHGDVSSLSRFDGRSVSHILTPFSNNGRRFDTLDGKSGWAAEDDGLRHLQDGKWQIFPALKLSALSSAGRKPSDSRVLDLGESSALLLFSNRLARFSSKSGRLDELHLPQRNSQIGALTTFARDPAGSVWVIGTKGVAHFLYAGLANAPLSWQEYPFGNLAVENPQYPVLCPKGEVFLTAFRKQSRERVILHMQAGKWEILEGGPHLEHASFAWRDGSGDLWLASDLLYRKSAANPEDGWVEVDSQSEVLSGKINDVLVNSDGTFFMATSFGLAMHINVAWKTLGHATDSRGNRIELKKHMGAMLEDRRQRLWILGEHSILRLFRERWEEYPLPRDYVLDINQRNSLGELSDGRILIKLEEAPYLIIFDPVTGKIAQVKPMQGYRPITFCRRTDGRFLVAMAGTGLLPDALAILDAAGSLAWLTSIPVKWNVHYPRGMVETASGEIWVGGTSGLARFANGQFERFDWIDLPPDAGTGSATTTALQIFSMLDDGKGGILFGGRQLLGRWNGKGLEFLNATPLVQYLYRDQSNTLWAATAVDIRRALSPLKSAEIELNDAWISNDVSDGLPKSATNAVLEDSLGRIWVISDKGLAILQQNVDHDPPEASIQANQNMREAASSGDFRVIFAGKDKWDLTPPDELRYSYRLDQRPWSSLTTNTLASFHHLPVGKHVFEVVALDHQGNLSIKPARFEVAVVAPWYRTPAFLILACCCFAIIASLLSLAFYQYRTRGRLMHAATAASQETQLFLNSIPSLLIGLDAEGMIIRWNPAAEAIFSLSSSAVEGKPLGACGIEWVDGSPDAHVDYLERAEDATLDKVRFVSQGATRILAVKLVRIHKDDHTRQGILMVGADVTETIELETQLRQAQKLEAIGQLAAGIAHEINTPTQYINDNVTFVRECWGGVSNMISVSQGMRTEGESGTVSREMLAKFDSCCLDIDVDYLLEEVPRALEQSQEGLRRVATIVQAMKEFTHPGSEGKKPLDINHAIAGTVTVSTNEWRYVAELETIFDANLPLVPCLGGEFNQVILNLVINAAHAIAAKNSSSGREKGKIIITTQCEPDWVEIRIQDDGAGITEGVQDRVFEPFFTTKEVGKGTGQGLALARTVIVKKHGGQIWFKSEGGMGTTFFIRLPVAG